VALEENSI
jgi:hypothetical protein